MSVKPLTTASVVADYLEGYGSVLARGDDAARDALTNAERLLRTYDPLVAQVRELLALAKRYASECGECAGRGTYKVISAIPPVQDCEQCADIRALISKVEGELK